MQCAVEGPEKHLDQFFETLYDAIEREPTKYGGLNPVPSTDDEPAGDADVHGE